jgi:hypothetical protein
MFLITSTFIWMLWIILNDSLIMMSEKVTDAQISYSPQNTNLPIAPIGESLGGYDICASNKFVASQVHVINACLEHGTKY